jgi:hypothetical protein
MAETTVVPPSSVVRGVRRAAIIAIVASLAIAALLGIIALLSGEFGELQGKVLLTTLTVAAFGTTALCHLAIVTRSVRVVGFVGIGASFGAALCALVLIWVDWDNAWQYTEWWWKSLAVLSIVAVSLAQVNLLLLLAGRRQPLIRIALAVTLAAVAVVGVMLALPTLTNGDIPGDQGDGYWRIFGVVAILDALGTIALPILGLVLGASAASRPDATTATPAPAQSPRALELPPELAARIDEAAALAGVAPRDFALDAIARALAQDSTVTKER